MKYLLRLLTTLTVFSTNVAAQSYIPMPDSNAVWMQGAGLYNFYGNHPYATCDNPLSFGTDTVINARTYHRLYGQKVCNWLNTYLSPPPAGTIVSGTDYYAFSLRAIFRQDTAQKKVYLYDMFSHRDTLLYDFANLVVGQPYPATFAAPSQLNLSVSSQYTMALGGNTHRAWKLSTVTQPDVVDIIEGIGSSQGFGTQILIPFESMNYLHCFSKAGNVLFSNPPRPFYLLPFPSNGACDITLNTTEQERKISKPFIFPNPAESVIHISIASLVKENAVMEVYNTLGELSLSAPFSETLDVSSLQQGMYIILVKNKTQDFQSRFVKQ